MTLPLYDLARVMMFHIYIDLVTIMITMEYIDCILKTVIIIF